MSINLFKRSVNGYNRLEVDEYILSLSKNIEKIKKDYDKKIEILEVELNDANRKKDAAEKELSDAVEEAASLRLKLEAADESLAAVRSEYEAMLSAERSRRADENAISKDTPSDPSSDVKNPEAEDTDRKPDGAVDNVSDSSNAGCSPLDSIENADKIDLLDKINKFNEISRNLGEILLNANASASVIVRTAEERADTIAKNAALAAEEQADLILKRANKDADDIISLAHTRAEAMTLDAKKNAEEIISVSGEQAQSIINDAKARAGVIMKELLKEIAGFSTRLIDDINSIASRVGTDISENEDDSQSDDKIGSETEASVISCGELDTDTGEINSDNSMTGTENIRDEI